MYLHKCPISRQYHSDRHTFPSSELYNSTLFIHSVRFCFRIVIMQHITLNEIAQTAGKSAAPFRKSLKVRVNALIYVMSDIISNTFPPPSPERVFRFHITCWPSLLSISSVESLTRSTCSFVWHNVRSCPYRTWLAIDVRCHRRTNSFLKWSILNILRGVGGGHRSKCTISSLTVTSSLRK